MAAAAAAPVRSPLGATTEAPDPTPFAAWCQQRRVLWPKCSTGVSPVTGRCVLATADIARDEVVVEVPDDAVLMGENSQLAQHLAEDGLLKPAQDALLEVQGLILAVMYEHALGAASAWGPYLAFLPQDMSHMPLYWSDAELEELRGTAALDKLEGRVQHPADAPTRVSQLFDELVLPWVLAHEDVAAVLLDEADSAAPAEAAAGKRKAPARSKAKARSKQPRRLSEEAARQRLWPRYQWATAAVASYSFVLGDDQFQGMVPVWDHLNHVTGQVNVRLHHDAERGVLQMIATSPIAAGAEVVNCYGALSNAELLRGYGYVEPNNPSELKHVQVPAHFLLKAAAAARQQGEAAAAPGGAGASGGAEAPGAEAAGERSAAPGSGTDEASSEEAGSEASEGSEPEWDLQDDSERDLEQQQQRQQQAVRLPSLADAQQHAVPDWEARWQLAFSLGLLPDNGVFQLPAGGLARLPRGLLPLLLVLLADAAGCQALAAAAAAATQATDDAAAAAAAAGGGCSNGAADEHSKQQPARSSAPAGAAHDKQHAEGAASVSRAAVDAALADVQLGVAPSLLAAALQALVLLMQSRYSCSLEQDAALAAKLQELPPRLAAAVVARTSEKQVWRELQQAVGAAGVGEALMCQARQGMAAALHEQVAAAAAGGGCCGGGGHCHHQHGGGDGSDQPSASEGSSSGSEEEAEDEAAEAEEQAAAAQAGGGSMPKRGGRQQAAGKAKRPRRAAAGGCDEQQEGFAFNFKVA